MIGAAAAEVAGMLTDAGVPAVADAEKLTTPGALVAPKRLNYDRLAAGVLTVDWVVYLVVGDYPAVEALDRLGELLRDVAGALPVGEVEPVTLTLPSVAAAPLPALSFTITTEVETWPSTS